MKIIAKLLVIFSLILSFNTHEVAAQGVPTQGLVREKGKATIKYAGIFRVGSDERRIAMDKALVNCIDRYMAQLPKARYEIFRKNALAAVEKNPAPYIGNVTIIKEHTDKTTKTFDIIVEADIDVSKLNGLLEDMLPKGGLSEEDAIMSFVAMARYTEKKVITKDQERNFELLEEAEEEAKKEANKLDLKGEQLEVFLKKERSKAFESIKGGDTTKRAPVNIKNVEQVDTVDAAISDVFDDAKFTVFPAGILELDLDQFKADFAKDGQVSAATLRVALKQLNDEGIKFLILASLDVQLPYTDRATGQTAVTCFVNAKVFELKPSKTGKFVLPLQRAAMAGIPFKGLGTDDEVAKQNAVNLAAKNTAEILRDKLRAKGLTP